MDQEKLYPYGFGLSFFTRLRLDLQRKKVGHRIIKPLFLLPVLLIFIGFTITRALISEEEMIFVVTSFIMIWSISIIIAGIFGVLGQEFPYNLVSPKVVRGKAAVLDSILFILLGSFFMYWFFPFFINSFLFYLNLVKNFLRFLIPFQ